MNQLHRLQQHVGSHFYLLAFLLSFFFAADAQCAGVNCPVYNAQSTTIQEGASVMVYSNVPGDPDIAAAVASLNADTAANGTSVTYTIATTESDFSVEASPSTPILTLNIGSTSTSPNVIGGHLSG